MASRRLAIAAVTNDALADQDIRQVEVPSIVNMWATAETVTDTVGLRLDKTVIMDDGPANISAVALGMLDIERDQLVFDSVVGPGTLRLPVASVAVGVSILISVEPIL